MVNFITAGAVVKRAAEYGKTRKTSTAASIAFTLTKQVTTKLYSQYPAILAKLPNVPFKSSMSGLA